MQIMNWFTTEETYLMNANLYSSQKKHFNVNIIIKKQTNLANTN